ncbi:MAG: Uma2 family endonuclease [Hyphomonadaceae bacterium]|nr:Uma2 family endonuclease [Hyphomonadaceae bacterium]
MPDTASLAPRPTTPSRKRFTGEEVLALIAKGALAGDRVELLDGEIWEMASEGPPHGRLAVWLNKWLILNAPAGVSVACERTIRLADAHWPEPDFFLFPERLHVDEVRGADVLLLIEIADTSLQDDLTVKGPKYREYGVREYWVIDLGARVTHVHRLDGAWPEEPPVPFDAPLRPAHLAGLELILAEAGV